MKRQSDVVLRFEEFGPYYICCLENTDEDEAKEYVKGYELNRSDASREEEDDLGYNPKAYVVWPATIPALHFGSSEDANDAIAEFIQHVQMHSAMD